MTKIFDTLTTKLSDLRDGVARDAAHMGELERYLRMGAHWVNEREAQMAEMFAHLFPAAYAEPLVDAVAPSAVLDKNLAIGKIIPLVTHGYQSTPTEDNPTGFLVDRRMLAPRRVHAQADFRGSERRMTPTGADRRRPPVILNANGQDPATVVVAPAV